MKTLILLTLAFLTFNNSARAMLGDNCLDNTTAHDVLQACQEGRDYCAHNLAQAAAMVQKDKANMHWYESARSFCMGRFNSVMVTGCQGWNWVTYFGMQCTDQAKEYNKCLVDLAQMIDPNVGKASNSNQNSDSKEKPVAGKDKEKPNAPVGGMTCY